MKKLTAFIALMLTAIAFATSCAATGEGEAASTDEPVATDGVPNESDDKLPDDAFLISTEKGCRIVYAEGFRDAANDVYDAILKLDSESYSKIGYYEVTKDSKPDDDKVEIIIGNTNREATGKAKQSIGGYLDFCVRIIDGDIVIFAYDEKRLYDAVEHFVSCLSYTEGSQLIYTPSAAGDVGRYGGYIITDLKLGGRPISDYTLIYSAEASASERKNISDLISWLGNNTGAIINSADDSLPVGNAELLVGKTNRQASIDASESVTEGSYIMNTVNSGERTAAVLAYDSPLAMYVLFEKIMQTVATDKNMPEQISGELSEDMMIISKIDRLRDPCILLHDGTYYAYGTGWVCYKNTSGSLDGEWSALGQVVEAPDDASGDFWAPEVHKYKDAFYMFTTYKSAATGHRGCAIFRSATPEGPFVEISDGHVTPKDWDSIDGTLYIDEDSQPWMIFVHEWTSTSDGIGRMAAAKLSDDLKSFISDPIELFRADDPTWAK